MKDTVVVTTTIRVPTFLEDVCKNAILFKRQDVSFIIIGDKKTPVETQGYCQGLGKKFNFNIEYYGIKEQENKLKDYPALLKLMPYNSGSRKLIGNFMAYLDGYNSLIMLDDDNYVTNHDFFGYHGVVGKNADLTLFQANSGWYNVYEAVLEEHNIPFYPRGYPWSKRFISKDIPTQQKMSLKVAVNNGLVLEDPDIDAISRLFWPIRVVGMKKEFVPQFGLQPGTWSSFNNQNTAISKEVIPVFFTPPATGRNADIWTSFLICRLAQHMNEVVAYGYPLVNQYRNVHNLWADLEDERINDKATDLFVDVLRSVNLTGPTYLSALGELIEGSLAQLADLKNVPEAEHAMLLGFFKEYKIWHGLFKA